MKYNILLAIAASIVVLGCGAKAGNAIADAIADTLLPSDVASDTSQDAGVDVASNEIHYIHLPSDVTSATQ